MKPVIIFLLAMSFDIASMNLPDYFSQSTGDTIYFLGQSIAVFLYILTVAVVSKDSFIINTISSAWSVIALNDVSDNIFDMDEKGYFMEYLFFALSFMVVCWKIFCYYNPVHKRLFSRLAYRIKKNIFVKLKTKHYER